MELINYQFQSFIVATYPILYEQFR